VAKKALCIGINDYPYNGSDLNGCVNDAQAWAALLREHFDFPSSDVALLVDGEATKQRVMDGLKNILRGAKKGDVLVFTNSSHGTYVAEKGGDEATYDEALCPYDTDENVIVDDELRDLFAEMPAGVRLTVISDSCHSGTVTRASVSDNLPGLRTPDDRRVRFLNPALRGDPVLENPWKARPTRFEKYPESGMNEVLLSGCTDREYSYDAFIDGQYHGAMSYYALRVIRDANYRLTYAQLHARVSHLVDDGGYPQHPQLEGKQQNKRSQIFA
jgi:hypothetical protein